MDFLHNGKDVVFNNIYKEIYQLYGDLVIQIFRPL